MTVTGLGGEVGYPEEMSRQELIELINCGKKFCTITTIGKAAAIHKGQEIYVIDLDGDTFLRTDFIPTDDQSAKRDKLENIPEFT